MEKLPLKFRKSGFDYEQVERNAMTAIYSQSLDGDILAYEVIVIEIGKAGEIMGNPVPEREIIPGNEKWGVKGWTYWSLRLARERRDQVEAKMLNDL